MQALSSRLSRGISETPFKNRPLALILAVFLCALFFVQISPFVFIIYAVGILLYSLAHAVFGGGFNVRENPLVYILPAAVLAAVLLSIPSIYASIKISDLVGERTVKAVIMQPYYEERFGALYLAKIVSIDGVRISGNITVEFTEQIEYSVYDTIIFKGIVSEAQSGLSGSELMLAKSRNLIAEVECTELISVTNESKSGFLYKSYLLNRILSLRLHELLPGNVAGYACAILLGDKSGVTATLRSDMSALGVSHILAVSGMHMSIIAAAVTVFADRFKTSRKLKSIIIISAALIFMTLVGFSASVVRAGIMLIIGMLAVFARGRADPITSLMLSGSLICIISPETVLSCSFLLSFWATLGIVLCALYAEQRARLRLYKSRVGDFKPSFKIVRAAVFSLIVSLCATLFTAPVMSLYFSEISFVSVLTNLFAVPMAFASMLLTLIVLIFGNIPIIGELISRIYTFLYNAFEALIKLFADRLTTTVSLEYPFFKLCLILLAGMTVFMVIKKIKSPIAYLGAFTVTAILFGGGVQIYSVAFADRAEAVYVCEKNSEGFIVNSGSDTRFIDVGNGAKKVTKYSFEIMQREYYETDFDGYMLTHYHSRHISTVKTALTENRIKKLYLPKPENGKEAGFYKSIKEVASESLIITYERGEPIKFGKAEITTSEYTMLERSTHPVIAMKISASGKSIAYIGSSVTESSAYIKANEFVSDVGAVICGAHGPSVKENHRFLSFELGKPVYLCPYEEAEETVLFPSATYVKPTLEDDGFAVLRFSLSS